MTGRTGEETVAARGGAAAGAAEAAVPACSGPLDARGFVELSEYAPEVLQEVRYATTYNFLGARVDGYEQPCALMTRQAARALRSAARGLAGRGLRLRVFDAYRPQRAVDHFVRWAADEADVAMREAFYPGVDKADLFDLGFVARRSSHAHGSTVDLTLVDERSGRELDMGSHFDLFGDASRTDYTGLSPRQVENRAVLTDAMLREGFTGIESEWWHFTLADEPYPDVFFDFPVRHGVAGRDLGGRGA